ncbi:MAG: CDP-archaeol synthase [Gammaproteobacteria bacterium]|nr:CDP-archaeol synthase [Gammaproteobacteria bacterium]
MLEILGLIVMANAIPVLLSRLVGSHANWPLDLGIKLGQQPLLGPSKTWRGLVGSLTLTPLPALLLGLSLWDGLVIASMAMLGDVLGSFSKRRLKIAPSDMAPGLDQIPESLLPTLAMKHSLAMSWGDVLIMVLLFIFIELLLSRLGFMLRIRKRPY